MSAFTPLFPLGIVVYPGEELRLHIFEPRYRQLVHDASIAGLVFGIPTVLDNKIAGMGTLVRLRQIVTVEDNGEMDIVAGGTEVFRITGPVELTPEKLYSGAFVKLPANDPDGDPVLMREIIDTIRQLHAILEVRKDFRKAEADLWSYDVAHHAGLSLREEYQLLELLSEREREEFLIRHLAKVLPVAREMGALRERVKLNGHFKLHPGLQ